MTIVPKDKAFSQSLEPTYGLIGDVQLRPCRRAIRGSIHERIALGGAAQLEFEHPAFAVGIGINKLRIIIECCVYFEDSTSHR